MPTGFTWNILTAQLAGALPGFDIADAGYANIMPQAIDSAELRILRDIDMLATRKYATSPFGTVTPGNALVSQPLDLVIPRYYGYYTPAGTQTKWTGLDRKEESYLRFYWPDRSQARPPKYFAVLGTAAFLISPSPDAAYISELGYTFRPTPLSASTPDTPTYISSNLPDLMFAAVMVFMCGYRQNYGQQADDPKMAVTWQSEYDRIKKLALIEEARRKAEQWADHSQSEPPSAAEVKVSGGGQ